MLLIKAATPCFHGILKILTNTGNIRGVKNPFGQFLATV